MVRKYERIIIFSLLMVLCSIFSLGGGNKAYSKELKNISEIKSKFDPKKLPEHLKNVFYKKDKKIRLWRRALGEISIKGYRGSVGINYLDKMRNHVSNIKIDLNFLLTELEPKANSAAKRLEVLNFKLSPIDQTKQEQQLNIEGVVKQVNSIQQEYFVYEGLKRRAASLLVKANELSQMLSDQWINQFTGELKARNKSFLVPSFWTDFFTKPDGFIAGARSFSILVSDIKDVVVELLSSTRSLFYLLVLIVFIFIFVIFARRILSHILKSKELTKTHAVSELSIYISAFLKLIFSWFVFSIILLFARLDFNTFLKKEDVSLHIGTHLHDLVTDILTLIAFLVVFLGVSYAMLNPTNTERSPTKIPIKSALRIISYVFFAVLFIDIGHITSNALQMGATYLQAIKGIGALLSTIVISFTIREMVRIKTKRVDSNEAVDQNTRGNDGLISFIMASHWSVVFITFLVTITGYYALGNFIISKLLRVDLIMFSAYIVYMFISLLFDAWVFGGGISSKRNILVHSMGISEQFVKKLGVIISGLLLLVTVIVAVILSIGQIGYSFAPPGEFLAFLDSGLSFQGTRITFSSLVEAILLFFLGIYCTARVANWLSEKYMPLSKHNVGIQNSIVTSFRYVGNLASLLFAVSFVGFDLTNFAIVAGALSVGIGFGLQSIASNFVSGLILLFERPIKIGDWVIVGSQEGVVQNINVRSTVIKTFDNATVIIPNSDFITGIVRNFTHVSPRGRIKVPISVSYDADPTHVKEVLLDCAKQIDGILLYPGPEVYFLNFGDYSLDFEVRVHLPDIRWCLVKSSEIRYALFQKLKEEGIEIPFPQHDIKIKNNFEISPQSETS